MIVSLQIMSHINNHHIHHKQYRLFLRLAVLFISNNLSVMCYSQTQTWCEPWRTNRSVPIIEIKNSNILKYIDKNIETNKTDWDEKPQVISILCAGYQVDNLYNVVIYNTSEINWSLTAKNLLSSNSNKRYMTRTLSGIAYYKGYRIAWYGDFVPFIVITNEHTEIFDKTSVIYNISYAVYSELGFYVYYQEMR